jgi:hypothetical protein
MIVVEGKGMFLLNGWYAHLKASGLGDDASCYEAPQTRPDAVNVANVSGLGEGETRHDLQKGEEHAVPHVEAKENHGRHQVRAHDGAVFEQVEGNESDLGAPLLPAREADEEQNAEYYHADDHGRLEAVALVGVDVEGEEEEGEAGDDEEEADGVELDQVVLDGLHEGAVGLLEGHEAGFLGFLVVVLEEGEEREADDGCDDGKAAVCPSPTDSSDDRHAVDHLNSQVGCCERSGNP